MSKKIISEGLRTFLSIYAYSVSHKVKISERFKSHRLEFKGQSSNLKHVEKNDELKLNGENVARFWRFSNIRLFQLYGRDYTSIKLQRKRRKTPGMQVSIL